MKKIHRRFENCSFRSTEKMIKREREERIINEKRGAIGRIKDGCKICKKYAKTS